MHQHYLAPIELTWLEFHAQVDSVPRELWYNDPSIHFCMEWDGMLICDRYPEFEFCRCLD